MLSLFLDNRNHNDGRPFQGDAEARWTEKQSTFKSSGTDVLGTKPIDRKEWIYVITCETPFASQRNSVRRAHKTATV